MGVRKYQTFNRGETQLAAATSTQLNLITDPVPWDATIVGAIVEFAVASEPIDSDGSTNVTGLVAIQVTGAALTEPGQFAANAVPFDTDEELALNDADNGDIWAMAPFAVVSSGPGTGRSGTNDRLMLAPKTKRKVRRGDRFNVVMNVDNSGPNQAVLGWIVSVTVFVLTD